MNNAQPLSVEEQRRIEAALTLSVQLHGMANHSQKSIPPSDYRVMETSERFREYMRTGKVPQNGNPRR
jgi:hypothetical protein